MQKARHWGGLVRGSDSDRYGCSLYRHFLPNEGFVPDGGSVNNRPWFQILRILIATNGTHENSRAARLRSDTVRSYSACEVAAGSGHQSAKKSGSSRGEASHMPSAGDSCDEVFCSTCLAFHQTAYHQKKPATEYLRLRKSASLYFPRAATLQFQMRRRLRSQENAPQAVLPPTSLQSPIKE